MTELPDMTRPDPETASAEMMDKARAGGFNAILFVCTKETTHTGDLKTIAEHFKRIRADNRCAQWFLVDRDQDISPAVITVMQARLHNGDKENAKTRKHGPVTA